MEGEGGYEPSLKIWKKPSCSRKEQEMFFIFSQQHIFAFNFQNFLKKRTTVSIFIISSHTEKGLVIVPRQSTMMICWGNSGRGFCFFSEHINISFMTNASIRISSFPAHALDWMQCRNVLCRRHCHEYRTWECGGMRSATGEETDNHAWPVWHRLSNGYTSSVIICLVPSTQNKFPSFPDFLRL